MNVKVSKPRDVVALLNGKLSDLLDEQLTVITLNCANKVIAIHYEVAKGGCNSVPISTKQIAKVAVDDYAYGIIIIHNHPSGDPKPSIFDIKETERVKAALNLLEITLLDHIIIGEDSYYSFNQEKTTKLTK